MKGWSERFISLHAGKQRETCNIDGVPYDEVLAAVEKRQRELAEKERCGCGTQTKGQVPISLVTAGSQFARRTTF
jgi:hypothetical protein